MSSQNIKVEELLKQVGIFDEVHQKHDFLSRIVRVMKSQGYMDTDTIKYRLAMVIYHAKNLTGQTLIPSLDDPGSIYLRSSDNPKLQSLINEMSERYKAVPTMELVRTFMCFVIAAYITEATSGG